MDPLHNALAADRPDGPRLPGSDGERDRRLKELGVLTTGIAHDLNNLLTPAVAAADLLRDALEGLSASPEDLGLLDELELSLDRTADLCARVLTFSRRTRLDPLPMDVADLFGQVTRLVHNSLPPQIRLDVDLPARGLTVLAEPSRLVDAILNLVHNSVHALSEEPGTIGLLALPETRGEIRLVVEDDGPGMTQAILDRARDVFFTTKGEAGNGLGLALVRQIASEHGGSLDLRSRPGIGTRAILRLPLHSTNTTAPEIVLDAPSAPGGEDAPARVLVIDDDQAIRDLLTRVLVRAGYEAIPAGSVADAASRLEQGVQPDLLLLDWDMPRQLGSELLPQLRALRGAVPVIVVSGRVDLDDATVQAAGATDLVHKPFAARDLLQLVETRLAEARERAGDSFTR